METYKQREQWALAQAERLRDMFEDEIYGIAEEDIARGESGKVKIVEGEGINLQKRNDVINTLIQYSEFLEEHGYLDTDWKTEKPYAIDEFMKTYK